MKTKKKSAVFFAISVIFILLVAYLGFFGTSEINGYRVYTFDEKIKKGLDLKGGVSVIEQVDSKTKISQATMDTTIAMLTARINKLGVSETVVVQEDKDKIRIELPGEKDTTAILAQLAKAGKLEFRNPDKTVILTGDDVKTATPIENLEKGDFEVNLEFNSAGAKKFSEATAKLIGQTMAIYMDEDLVSNPNVTEAINGGNASITHMASMAEAKRVADTISSGALPVTLTNVSADVVGASLGAEALPNSVKAGVVGIAIVMLFMLFYYRIPGLIADIALLLFVIMVLYTYTVVGVVLSLSGIAAFLLTVGMAVDANVLIFERTKEELKSGKSIKSAIDEGFHRAFTSIIDSNLTTLISGFVLYTLGTGSVKGFALTLIIGVTLSMFTALTVTRQLMKWAGDMGWFNKPSSIGTFGVHDMRRGVK
ncbi:MAG: protein translocase subunit SecD [Clostridiaceae bacterium]|nr:protein translocase subunit SecD [Clostridiaceae bacterium]